jgi:DNA-binding protein Fis
MTQVLYNKKTEKLQKNLFSLMVGMTIKDAEMFLIYETLDACDGNKTKASKLLGITDRTLRNKLNEYKNAEGITK